MPELSASLQSQLDSLYNYKPPKLGSSHGPYPKLDATVSFHDKHMDPRLALRRVILAPNLVHDLVAAGERALQTYKDSTDVELPPVSKGFVLPQISRDDVVDARSVGLVYAKGIAAPAIAIASMLLLHPNAPEWSDSLHFFENNRTTEKSDALNEDFAPSFMRRFDLMDVNLFNKTMAESMDESTRTRYRKAHEKFRRAAVWQMFFIRREARRALKRMDTVASSVASKYPTFRTKAPKIGPGSLDLPCFLDALETAWGLSMPKFLEAMLQVRAGSLPFRRSQRLAANIGEKAKSPEPPPLLRGRKTSKSSPSSGSPQIRSDWSTVLIPSYSESSKTDEEVAMSIIHRAWARAVEKDATFIVLHCGIYERIALRHRSSQTLFLSNLIKTTECSDPGYGAIHIGLFVSILSDVFDRVMQIEEQSTQISKKRRRPAVRAIEPHKRPRTRTIVASEEARKVTEQRQFQVLPLFSLLEARRVEIEIR
ncbi:hypothetical protein H0H93_000303 [Arthromyces matolae]|nr:hypothetical protein H0H93_000303 [Arthromyces matolae]